MRGLREGTAAPPQLTLNQLLQEIARALSAAGLDEPRREARALLTGLGDVSAAQLLDGDRVVAPEAAQRARAAAKRRAAREPLARILGSREFWSLPFALNAATLVPRPDSETLVEVGLAALPDRQATARLLDLGTGSGCLLLALLSERPAAWGLGIDWSTEACRQAAANAEALGLSSRAAFLAGDWAAALCKSARFELIVSNPPYIASADVAGLEPEVAQHDPRRALDGGSDGLVAYRRLILAAAALLQPGATLALEIGVGQAEAVAALLQSAGLGSIATRRDLAGHERVVSARAPRDG
ncbi:MAG: peptide chain release factor N(5)-glutamine methyltransferase [Pseudomonadota bacterium]